MRPVRRSLLTVLPRALAVFAESHHDLRSSDGDRAEALLKSSVEVCHRAIPPVRDLISPGRGDVAREPHLVTPGGVVQTRVRRLLAPACGALTDVATELVHTRVSPRPKIPITSGLTTVRILLIVTGTRLLFVRERQRVVFCSRLLRVAWRHHDIPSSAL
jgi:hypothetical protein